MLYRRARKMLQASRKRDKVKKVVAKAADTVAQDIPDEARWEKIAQELFDVQKIKEETLHFAVNFVDGLIACGHGVYVAVTAPRMQKKYRKYAKMFVAACVATAVVSQLIALPWRIILHILSLVVTIPESAFEGLDSFILWTVFFVPFIIVMGFRRFNPKPLEAMFFATLKAIDPEYATALRAAPQWSAQEGHTRSNGRLWRSLKLASVFRVLSLIPYAKIVAAPLADYLTINEKFGVKLSALFMGLMLCGYEHQVSKVMTLWISTRLLGMEALEPFLSRKQLPVGTQRRFLVRHDSLIIGFSLPLWLLIDLPYIGCLFVGLAFGAAAALALKLRDRATDFLTPTQSQSHEPDSIPLGTPSTPSHSAHMPSAATSMPYPLDTGGMPTPLDAGGMSKSLDTPTAASNEADAQHGTESAPYPVDFDGMPTPFSGGTVSPQADVPPVVPDPGAQPL